MELGGERLCRLEREKSEHARQLALFVDELLSRLRAEGKQIDAVAVSAGPGSYTGLRIGASLAKGLAYGLGVKMVAIPTLAILAETGRCLLQTSVESGEEPKKNPRITQEQPKVCPMIDARRMEVYTQLFDGVGKALNDVEAKVIDETSFAEELAAGPIVFLGNGAAKCKSVLTHENALFADGIVPDAAYMGRLAEEAMAKGDFADVAYWTPFYLKEFEAKKSVVKGLK